MKKEWNSPVYAFFASNPIIEYVGGRRSHLFKCRAKRCNKHVRRFLDKGDATSTGNMRKHVKSCWGEDVFHEVLTAKNAEAARDAVKSYLANGSITTAFERKGNSQVQYSHWQHTKIETRYGCCLDLCPVTLMERGRVGSRSCDGLPKAGARLILSMILDSTA